jgi:hypothetical protein
MDAQLAVILLTGSGVNQTEKFRQVTVLVKGRAIAIRQRKGA